MAAGKSSRINRQYKTKHRIRNWRKYERGLRSRGDVTIWLSEDAIAAWIPPKNGLRGGQRRYSNLAIRTALTLRVAEDNGSYTGVRSRNGKNRTLTELCSSWSPLGSRQQVQ